MIETATNRAEAYTVPRAIRERRSIDYFEAEVPPVEVVMEAIEHARWAPNHNLTEPWRFYLLSEPCKRTIVDLNAELVAARKGEQAGEAKRARWSSMPGWLVVTCTQSSDELVQQEDYAACCCAVYALCLHLWSRGIGTKWTTGEVTRDPRFYDAIWADPASEQVVAMIWYGYPSEIPVSARKPLSEIVVQV